ncbi:uncharacterized protein LOC128803184 [Vidua macroura]|uniref:uncharacterized protein LOC128803184 n=1 Tax=Vidua macroura TaxID=187451 RepID=UPI0023A83FB5|nr:uncharacterized protein LOC128803184 [Vidua macroura]
MNTEGEVGAPGGNSKPLCGLGAAPSPLRIPQALRRELEAAVWARGGALAPQDPSGAEAGTRSRCVRPGRRPRPSGALSRGGGNSKPLCGPGAAPSPLRIPQALRRELEAAVWARGGALAPQVPSGALSPGGGGISKPLFPPLSARRGSHARARRRPRAAPGVRQRRNGRLPSRVFTVFWFAGGRDEKPWDDEARASWRSGVFELKSGTARQERAGGAASSSSRVERRGKSELEERRLRAQEWNGEARASWRSGVFELKSGTARQEPASALAASSSGLEQREAVGRRGKSELEERRLRAQEWNGEARASFSIGSFQLRIGTARHRVWSFSGLSVSWSIGRRRGTTRQERQRLRAQEWNGEARASLELKRGHEGPSGQRAFPGQGTFRVPRLALHWAPSLSAGLGLCCAWPFAVVLLWLPGERGNARDPLYSGRVTAHVPVPALKRLSASRPLRPPWSARAGSDAFLSRSVLGMAP